MMLATLVAAAFAQAVPEDSRWPQWEAYRDQFISPDGRVIEPSAGARTTSEGQAYALFFALVAADRATFDRLARWTEDNLARGDLTRDLPAWSWGRDPSGTWRVLDANSASDADLWMAYALLQAARRFAHPRFGELGRAMLANVARGEVVELPGLGRTLLPGARGFTLGPARWRLNPSYLPIPVLRDLAVLDPSGPWGELAETTVRVLAATARHGFAPDWVVYEAKLGFLEDPVSGGVSSYDAIRAPLWAAMMPACAPERRRVLELLAGPLEVFRAEGVVPERVHVASGSVESRTAPPGFFGVVQVLAVRSGETSSARVLGAMLERERVGDLYGHPASYYDQNLILFSRGSVESWFTFDGRGRLLTKISAPRRTPNETVPPSARPASSRPE